MKKKAFFVARVTVKDPELFGDYAAKAGKSMEPFGGSVVTKGVMSAELVGSSTYQNIAVVEFPSLENLEGWYASEHYQSLIPLREKAAVMELIAYSAPA